jgi:hypothetical protein
MKMKSVWIMMTGVISGIVIASAWNVWGEEPENKKPAKTASQPAAETAHTLDEAAIRMGGIVAAPLKSISHRQVVQALGVVLSIQELNDLHNNYAAVKAQAEVAQTTANASRKEYERLKTLNADNRNVSDKAVQAAETVWRSDESREKAAVEALHTVEQNAKQQWGITLAKAIVSNAPLFRRVSEQQDVLVQVTLSGAYLASPPHAIRLQSPMGEFVEAVLISPSPRTDQRFQGESLFYSAPAQKTGLVPGMSLSAYLPVGPEEQGYLVPETAVVWWQAKAWVYFEESKGHYVKQELPTVGSVNDGWFVPKRFAEGKPVVVTGAQLLLSEELRAHTTASAGEDND